MGRWIYLWAPELSQVLLAQGSAIVTTITTIQAVARVGTVPAQTSKAQPTAEGKSFVRNRVGISAGGDQRS